jgi:signal peptidase II
MSKPPVTKIVPARVAAAKAAPNTNTGSAKAASALKPVKKSILPWIGFSVLLILLDQASKLWVQARLDIGAVVEITSYFNLVHVLNPGAAFSFLADQEGWQKHFLSGVAVVASIVILFMMRSSSHRKFAMFCLACILGGAIGNLIDRVLHGAVIDFLDFYIQTYHWPAFNVADVAISLGAVGLIIDEIFFNKEKPASQGK